MSEVKHEVLLQAKGIYKNFETSKKDQAVHALTNVDLTLYRGETLALVGESGCGKSTLGRTLIRMLPATRGSVTFEAAVSYTHLYDHIGNSAVIFITDAQVPMDRPGQIVKEPHDHRLIQPHHFSQAVNGGLVHMFTQQHSRRIAGNNAQHDEDEQYHADQHRNGAQNCLLYTSNTLKSYCLGPKVRYPAVFCVFFSFLCPPSIFAVKTAAKYVFFMYKAAPDML